jgi:hypothetical protein
MAHTYIELKGKTVAELREIAAGIQHEAVQGYTQLNKDKLLLALAKALNLDMHAHRKAQGGDKVTLKAAIRKAKTARDAAVQAKNHPGLRTAQNEIRSLKRKIRKLAGQTKVTSASAAG